MSRDVGQKDDGTCPRVKSWRERFIVYSCPLNEKKCRKQLPKSLKCSDLSCCSVFRRNIGLDDHRVSSASASDKGAGVGYLTEQPEEQTIHSIHIGPRTIQHSNSNMTLIALNLHQKTDSKVQPPKRSPMNS